ncbi:MAG: hypothetical protein KKE62_15960 [Proteobacteria bacterium]|nr:hypothetical protein [Pseudomonadota bacterium]MBU1387343.1 hypothetical protein [Pseudomonadota bacterium]MBU1544326.1 hypothetical protein [Pseudomonadota bacterium]MBU2482669.1 hypothetical protein [Pseudomonadota bacterium]
MTDMPDWDDDILGEDVADDVIELTDIVDDSVYELDTGVSGDGVIELTDIVEDDLGEVFGESVIELDDPVIELTDIVKEDTASEPDLALDDVEGDSLDFGDDFSMEDEFAEESVTESDVIGLPDDEPEEMLEEMLEEDPADPASVVSAPVVNAPAPEMNFGAEDIEAALERVIEKKFAGRMETLLFEVMEKVIEKEILQIKSRLLKDLDQNEND